MGWPLRKIAVLWDCLSARVIPNGDSGTCQHVYMSWRAGKDMFLDIIAGLARWL